MDGMVAQLVEELQAMVMAIRAAAGLAQIVDVCGFLCVDDARYP